MVSSIFSFHLATLLGKVERWWASFSLSSAIQLQWVEKLGFFRNSTAEEMRDRQRSKWTYAHGIINHIPT